MAINPYEQLNQAAFSGKPLTSTTQGGTGASARVGGATVKGQESTVNAPAPTEGTIKEVRAKSNPNNAQANVEPGNNPAKATDTRSGRRGMFDWMKPKDPAAGGGGGGNTYGDININTGSGIAGTGNKQIQGDGQIEGEGNELTIGARKGSRPPKATPDDMAPTPPSGTPAPTPPSGTSAPGGTPPRITGTPGGTPRSRIRMGGATRGATPADTPGGTPRPTLRTGTGSAAPAGSSSPRPRLRTAPEAPKELGAGPAAIGSGVKALGEGMMGGGDSAKKKQNFKDLQSATQSSLKNKVDTKPQPSNAPNSNSAETKTAVSGITAGMQAGQAALASGPKNASQPTKNGAPQQVADKEKAKKDAKGKVKAAVKSGPKNASAKKTGSKKPAMKADERLKAKPKKTSK